MRANLQENCSTQKEWLKNFFMDKSKDYSKKENQIGCGYCNKEQNCEKRDPKINKAKLGCEDFVHFEDSKNTK